jgi:tetratricopeptide (TPR) repeat protein
MPVDPRIEQRSPPSSLGSSPASIPEGGPAKGQIFQADSDTPSDPWSPSPRGLAVAAAVLLLPLIALFVHRFRIVSSASTAASAVGTEYAEFQTLIDASRALLQKGQAREALPQLERARAMRPDDPTVHNNLCVAHGMLRDRAQAITACERSLQLDGNQELARNNLRWVQSLPEASAP